MERVGVVLLLVASLQGLLAVHVEVFPAESVVSVGQNVSMLCRVSVPIQYCRIVVPGLEAPLNLNPVRGPTPPSNAVYLGDGLEKGHCGVSIPSVEDKYNGVFKCTVGVATEAHESEGAMVVVVARAPKVPPVMELTRPRDPQDSYQEGERFLATCEVPEGRPAANITWFIGDDPVTEDLARPEIFENRKDNLFSIRQNLTREVRWSDNGKELRCVASHPIIGMDPARTTARKRINVKFAPKPAPGDLEQFGFIEGEEGLIAVRIKANPKPSFLWTVGRENIDEGSLDTTGHFEVGFAEPKGYGEWETKLHIRPVTKDDVEREYRVQATNTIGQQDYVVRISTSSQPRAMAEMGAGAIVGIVIAVLLVLLIIFIVVFARATGRWCFAGGAATLRTGETSDTESADQGPAQKKNIKKKAKLPLTSMFKKAKDKVAGDTEILKAAVVTEEKDVEKAAQQVAQDVEKGKECVYAELTHSQAAERARPVVVRPEDDKTEYAEIVHTKDEKKSDK
ncbi:fasciclin-3 isoform X3 [Frankliniella occidentalis]|uniref:Fasciclin-3 isoform X3 n=1 Tax=Frankliniella occidentalis TaxID=133901 RepID=A0A9C6WWR6_FRAOC|nr:fasciclin-3 isoform X3 [Frankliniella occidentalis]